MTETSNGEALSTGGKIVPAQYRRFPPSGERTGLIPFSFAYSRSVRIVEGGVPVAPYYPPVPTTCIHLHKQKDSPRPIGEAPTIFKLVSACKGDGM